RCAFPHPAEETTKISWTGGPSRVACLTPFSASPGTSAFRQRYDRQTAMVPGIEGAYSKDYIVLGKRQSGPSDIAHPLNMLPVGRGGIAPQDFIGRGPSAGGSLPGQRGIVLQLFGEQAHIGRRRRS